MTRGLPTSALASQDQSLLQLKKDADRRARNRAAVERYRKQLKEDPDRFQEEKDKNKERAWRNRQKPKLPEQIERERLLRNQRQARYAAKKKAEAAAMETPPVRQTRQDKAKDEKRKDSVRLAVQKHRQNQHPNKKRRVREQRREYYYRKKNEKEEILRARREKAVQAEVILENTDCPYPNKNSYQRAVRRVREKMRAKGNKFAFLVKGLIKFSDKTTKEALENMHIVSKTPPKQSATTPLSSPAKILHSHLRSLSRKRDKTTLSVKRNLAKAFKNTPKAVKRIGLSKYILKKSPQKSLYTSSGGKLKKTVAHFLDEQAAPIPCKTSTAKKQLLKSVKELHRDFTLKNNKVKVSLRSFHRLKPKNVQSVTKLKFRQCLCDICQNPKSKVARLNCFLENKIENVRQLLDESLCTYEGEFPKLECVNRQCQFCGVERVCNRIESDLCDKMQEQIKWSKWEMVKQNVGKLSRMEKVSKCGSLYECVKELMNELGPLCKHLFVADWQRNQLQSLKSNLPEDWAIVTMDFAENFLCKFQDEPQSAHWGYSQVTVFPVVAHTRCKCGGLRRDCLVFLTDDLRHDAVLSQVFIDKALAFISGIRKLKKIVLVSDGCAAQFKSKLPFLFLARTKVQDSSTTEIEKVFFGSRHGKNDSDWCGGAVKRNVTRDIASGAVTIKTALDMFEHCSNKLSHSEGTGQCLHNAQQFFFVDVKDVRRDMDSGMVKTIPGSRKIHHLRVLAENVLGTRDLSCFCPACMAGDWAHCLSAEHVRDWQIVKLKFTTPLPPCLSNQDGGNVVQRFDALSHADPDRKAVFHDIAKCLRNCLNFVELKEVARTMQAVAKRIPIPSPSICSVAEHTTDVGALSLLEPHVQQQCLTLNVQGDGNCFFRSLSLLLFGSEDHHEEMRCRVTIEMALNSDLFLDGSMWCTPCDHVTPESVIHVAHVTSVSPNTSKSIALEQEVLHCAQNGTYCGLWIMFAASYVLRCPIHSVFPPLGWELYRTNCNRIIRPPNCISNEKLHIMWSSTRADAPAEHWVPNHFVPLVLARPEQRNGPQVGSFHMVLWERKMYVAVVKETDELLELACVLFYDQKPGTEYYKCPVRPEYSWEPFSSVREMITLEMDASVSSHRRPLFKKC